MVLKSEDTKVYTYSTKSLDDFAVALALGAEVVAVDRVSDDRFYTFSLQAGYDIEKTCLQRASRTLQGPFPGADRAFRRALALPFHTGITEVEADRVAHALARFA